MTKSKMNPKVDFYFSKTTKWQEEIQQLRMMVLDCGVTEGMKWGVPCYMFENSNIILIHVFKHYCALLFFKGALLKDPKKILVQQTENVQSARQVRFTSMQEIMKQEPILKAYIAEAIQVDQEGLKVDLKKVTEYAVPEELQKQFSSRNGQALKTAFEALTPGRQRAYLLYFSAAKQSKTREARIEKCVPLIMKGKGLNDD